RCGPGLGGPAPSPPTPPWYTSATTRPTRARSRLSAARPLPSASVPVIGAAAALGGSPKTHPSPVSSPPWLRRRGRRARAGRDRALPPPPPPPPSPREEPPQHQPDGG